MQEKTSDALPILADCGRGPPQLLQQSSNKAIYSMISSAQIPWPLINARSSRVGMKRDLSYVAHQHGPRLSARVGGEAIRVRNKASVMRYQTVRNIRATKSSPGPTKKIPELRQRKVGRRKRSCASFLTLRPRQDSSVSARGLEVPPPTQRRNGTFPVDPVARW
jgi:hypothetical protein